MRAAAGRLARQLEIVANVVVEPGLDPARLAARVGISERTLSRDLRELRRLGYEIEHDRGYRLEEPLDFYSTQAAPGSLDSAFDRHAAAVRSQLGESFSEAVVADVSALAPAAVAALFASSLRRRAGLEGPSPLGLSDS